VLFANHYMTTPEALHCPSTDDEFALGDKNDPGGWKSWNHLINRIGIGNRWSISHGKSSGYSSFLMGMKHIRARDNGYPWLGPKMRMEGHWKAPTLDWIVQNQDKDTPVGNDVSPMMYGCAVTGKIRPHASEGRVRGINGVMADGSARWISESELGDMVEAHNDANGSSLLLEHKRWMNTRWFWENPNPFSYGGNKTRFNVFARRYLELSP